MVCVFCVAVRAVRWHDVAAGTSWVVIHMRLRVLTGGLGLLIDLIFRLTISCKAEKGRLAGCSIRGLNK